MHASSPHPAELGREFIQRFFQVPRAEIAYLRFILESYDGLAFLRSLDGAEGVVLIGYPPSREAEARQLLDALALEIALTELPPREVPPW